MKLSRLADLLRQQQLEPEAPISSDASYQLSRARRESAAAELARIELRSRAAELVDAAALSECLADVAAIVRCAIGPLPGEITEAIRPLAGDEPAIRVEMQRRIDAALARAADALEGGG